MSSTPSQLAYVICDVLLLGGPGSEFFARVHKRRIDLAFVLDVLSDPFEHLAEDEAWEVAHGGWVAFDPLYCMVECVGLERAREVARRTKSWSDVDVQAHHAGVRARQLAADAIMDEVAVVDAYALITDPSIPNEHRVALLARLAHVYPTEALATLPANVPDSHVDIVAGVLRKHSSALEALEDLARDVEEHLVLRALERFWAVPVERRATSESALLGTYALLCHREGTGIGRVLEFARMRGEASWWMPILREHEFKTSHAALHLLEAGESALEIARSLQRAGYDDEQVLAALLENGLGQRDSLSTLRQCGWDIDRMAKTLASRGALPSELRAQLAALGVGSLAQRSILERHFEATVVRLVMDDRTPLRLPASDS